MTEVNWELNIKSWGDGLGIAHSESSITNAVITEMDTAHRVLLHDPETSNDQEVGVKRVLDDSPEKDWFEFFKYTTPMENHRGFSKEQRDGSRLVLIEEAYHGHAHGVPPLYFLIKE
jgi:hypothetical protein